MNDLLIASTVKLIESDTCLGGQGVLVRGGLILTASHCLKWDYDTGTRATLGDHLFVDIEASTEERYRVTPKFVDVVGDLAALEPVDIPELHDEHRRFVAFAERVGGLAVSQGEPEFTTDSPLQERPIRVRSREGVTIEGVATYGRPGAPQLLVEAEVKSGTSGGRLCTELLSICRLTHNRELVGYTSDGIQPKATTMRNAIGYLRVSTTSQADDGVSLAAQRERVAAWCLANDCELSAMFTDAGVSGARADNRPELQSAITTACSTGAVLVVYSLSRLARSTKDTIDIAERLERSGADLVSLTEKIDTTTAAGKMVFRMLAVLSEFERDLVAERTTVAMDHKRSRGERIGKIPFGYDLANDGVSLVPNRDEQRAIEIIGELREAGESLRAIATELTRRGISTKERKGQWTHTAVNRIVKRQAA